MATTSSIKKIFTLCTSLLLVIGTKAQQFNYSLSSDSASVYAPLTSAVTIADGSSPWNAMYKKEIGFNFSFLGHSFDSVTIEKNNYIVFDKERKYAILAFPGFNYKTGGTANSNIKYSLEGSSPSRTLKIQFEQVGQSPAATEYINYQVWLHENGKIDFVMGAHSYPVADSTNYNDTINPVQIGLINPNMDTPTRGLFLSGSPTMPTSQPVNDNIPDISFLRSFPREGTKYSFIPMQ